MKRQMNPRLKMILSMTMFGTISLFVRMIPVSSGELAFDRAALAALLTGGVLLMTRKRTSFSEIRRELPLLLASGAAMGINWILLFQAYRYTTVSLATLSYYFAPVIVTAVCPFLFKEKLARKQILCFAMSCLGLVLITGVARRAGETDTVGILYGLGAAVFYAAVMLLNKTIKNVEGIQRTFYQFAAAVAVLFPYVMMTGGMTLGSLDSVGWINLLVVGLIHTGVTYCLYLSAMKELPGQETAILCYIDPLVAVLISVTVLGESMTLPQVIGGVLILGFTLWNELGKS